MLFSEKYLITVHERNRYTDGQSDPSSRFAATDMGRKLEGLCPFLVRRSWVPSNTMWPGSRPALPYTNWHPSPSNRLATIYQRYRQTGRQTMVR